MKAILMLNEMPESCKDCILCNDNWWCVADDEPTDDKKRPNWCPLKPMPEKKKELSIEETIVEHRLPNYMYASSIQFEKAIKKAKQRGYNECIDEILGG